MLSYFLCLVARVIDAGTKLQLTGLNTISIDSEQYGYIVSHQNYGQEAYWNSHNWTLTLTGFQSSMVEILCEQIDLESSYDTKCFDYLLIQYLNKICTVPRNKSIMIELDSSTDNLTLTFYTDGSSARKGFWLVYKGTKVIASNSKAKPKKNYIVIHAKAFDELKHL